MLTNCVEAMLCVDKRYAEVTSFDIFVEGFAYQLLLCISLV